MEILQGVAMAVRLGEQPKRNCVDGEHRALTIRT